MKVAIIIADKVRQVMFTAETPMEQQALDMLSKPKQKISVEFKTGTFMDQMPPSAHGYLVRECRGDYMRAYDSPSDSLMLVLRDVEPVKIV